LSVGLAVAGLSLGGYWIYSQFNSVAQEFAQTGTLQRVEQKLRFLRRSSTGLAVFERFQRTLQRVTEPAGPEEKPLNVRVLPENTFRDRYRALAPTVELLHDECGGWLADARPVGGGTAGRGEQRGAQQRRGARAVQRAPRARPALWLQLWARHSGHCSGQWWPRPTLRRVAPAAASRSAPGVPASRTAASPASHPRPAGPRGRW